MADAGAASAAADDELDRRSAASGDDSGSDSGSESGSGSDGGSGSGKGSGSEGSDADFTRRRRRNKKNLRAARQRAAAQKAAERGSDAASTGGSQGVSGRKRKRSDAKKPRKPQSFASRYLDIAAEEAGEDEEEEGERLGKRARTESIEATEEAYARVRAEADIVQRKREAAKSAEEIAAEIEAREKETRYMEADDFLDAEAAEAAEAAGLLQQSHLPDAARDPKLWMLKCKEGSETAIMISLANKYISLTNAGNHTMGIMSAVCTGKWCVAQRSWR